MQPTWGVRRAIAIAVVCAPSATACSLVGLDGLSDGAEDAAGSDVQLDGPGDAPSDGALSDRTGDDADVGPWCLRQSPAPAFCADFDEGSLTRAFENGVPVQIAAPTVEPGGSATLDPDASSPPGAFTASASGTVDGGIQARYRSPVTLSSVSGVRFAFDMRIDADDANNTFTADLFFDHAGQSHSLETWVNSAGGGYNWSPGSDTPVAGASPGPWVHMEITVDLASGKIAETMNGGSLFSSTVTPLFSTADTARFYLGVHVYAGTTTVSFDNVVFAPYP